MMGRSPGTGGTTQRFNWRMMGTAIGSPTFSVPWANSTPPGPPRSGGEAGPAALDGARHVQHLTDRICRTVEPATATTVTQGGEDEHFLPDDGDGVVLAHLGAASAAGTGLGVYLRYEQAHLAALLDHGPEKEGGVGLLHIAVQEQRMRRIDGEVFSGGLLAEAGRPATPGIGHQAQCQADGDGGLAGPSLATGYSDDHGAPSHLARVICVPH